MSNVDKSVKTVVDESSTSMDEGLQAAVFHCAEGSFEVRCPSCDTVPGYFVRYQGGVCGVRFWCVKCKRPIVLTNRGEHIE